MTDKKATSPAEARAKRIRPAFPSPDVVSEVKLENKLENKPILPMATVEPILELPDEVVNTNLPDKGEEKEMKMPVISEEERGLTDLLCIDIEKHEIKGAEQEQLTIGEVTTIVNKIANNRGISPATVGKTIALLFSAGAANRGTPLTLEIPYKCPQTGSEGVLSKLELMSVLRNVTGNDQMRRLAKAMAVSMGLYAEQVRVKKGIIINGDLARSVNRNLQVEGKAPLSSRERIWCSSYCQNLDNLAELSGSDRLRGLLAHDELQRFGKKEQKPKGKDKGKGKEKPQKNEQS